MGNPSIPSVAKGIARDTMIEPQSNGEESHSSATEQPLSPETIHALQELGGIFEGIHRRLASEGYVIREGKFLKPTTDETKDGTDRPKK